MLTLLMGTDWISNRTEVLNLIAKDVTNENGGRILIVPELISHETERRLCASAGDTASRFAEVLSFSRLARRVADFSGHAIKESLDNGGRIVTMASATRQLHSKLKAYAAVETKPEFLSGLLDAVDEFKRCCITAEDLRNAAMQTAGSFAQKLEELSLLLDSYNALCQQGKRDPRDQMALLLEELEDGDFAQSHVFYIDGFPDFTRQHTAIVEHLIRYSENVTVSLNCDKAGSSALAFEKSGATASELLHIAQKWNVPVEIRYVPGRTGNLDVIREKLFQGDLVENLTGKSLQVYRTETLYQECVAVAEKIVELVRSGVRYRQIGIACGDMPAYRNTIEMVFNRCHIPVYLSGTEDILDKSVIKSVLTAIDAALDGFDRKDVIAYLKSVLSPLDFEVSDELENYSVLWGINANRWLSDWTNHPDGLGAKWTDAAKKKLAELNNARKLALKPLVHLRQAFMDAKNLGQQVRGLYTFFEEISLSERLDKLALQMDARGDNRNTQMLNQLWDILLTAMEQLYDTLGNTTWEPEVFSRLFKLLLSQYSVGTIPPVLDAVTVGSVSTMRCQKTTHLFVVGMLEDTMPGYSGAKGILTDQERNALRKMGLPLTGGAIEGLQAEFAEIYGTFCGADETISVFCPGGQPSFIFNRLKKLAGEEKKPSYAFGAALRDSWEAGAFFANREAKHASDAVGVNDVYQKVCEHRDHTLGTISRENIEKLYGNNLKLSASQIDKQAQCRFSYFLKYGLRVKECKEATVDPAEFGTYVHVVLEQTVREIMERGGFQRISAMDALQIAQKYSEAYEKERFSGIDTERLAYLFRRNNHELSLIVEELWKEMQDSKFSPVAFELGFGDNCQLPSIGVDGGKISARLGGFIDRVDTWSSGDNTYFRVVDYKTGKKDFDYCDVINGIGLQMLLYLFALQNSGYDKLECNPIPAGVQYFPARVPIVSADNKLTKQEAEANREKLWVRKGLLLNDEAVIGAMCSDQTENRMPYTRKKDGAISGDLADSKQFKMLKDYIFGFLEKMIDEIATGNISPNPYSRGACHSACTYCPYGTVCHEATVDEKRNYKAITAGEFWEQVEKEVSRHG